MKDKELEELLISQSKALGVDVAETTPEEKPDRRLRVAPMVDPMSGNDALRKPWGYF